MKKLLLYSLAVFLLASSCSKERSSHSKPPVNTGKKYAVKFNVDGFTQTINTINKKTLDATTTGLSDNAKVLYYYAGNTTHFFTELKQTSASSEFGNITDSLAAGTYTIVFIAGQTGLQTFYIGNNSHANSGYHGFYFSYNIANGQFAPWQDTFYKKLTLTVTNQGVTQAVSLDRVVGEVQVNIEDAIPANLKTIKLTFNYEDAGYRIETDSPINPFDTPRSYISTITIPDTAIGKTNYKLNTIIGNTITPMSVNITCLDAANNTLSVTTVSNVSCQKNVKTILSGKLFADASVFHVSFDPTWDPTPINVHF